MNQISDLDKGKITHWCYTTTNEVAERLTDVGKNMRVSINNPQTTKKTRKNSMLANLDIKRWYDNTARGSRNTAEVRLRRLDRFCQLHQITPMELVELGRRDLKTITDLLEDHVSMMEEKGYAPAYIEGLLKSVKSWLRHFDVIIQRRIRITNAHLTPTLENERVPNEQELTEIFNKASQRDAVIISLMAKSGLRPEVLGNDNGTEGLKMKDLPDVIIQGGIARCISKPMRIMVRTELSKARHQYFTFATSASTEILLSYLNERLANGEPLHGNSPIVAPYAAYKKRRGGNNGKSFLPTKQVSNRVRQVFRPRFTWRPYVLRAYFDTQLLIAESKGKIAHDFRVFFMGHRGSIEATYTTNKSILPEDLLEAMRDSFQRSEEHLDIEDVVEDKVEKTKELAHETIQKATPEQLGAILETFQKLGVGKMLQVSA